jgi:hypothetical protein
MVLPPDEIRPEDSSCAEFIDANLLSRSMSQLSGIGYDCGSVRRGLLRGVAPAWDRAVDDRLAVCRPVSCVARHSLLVTGGDLLNARDLRSLSACLGARQCLQHGAVPLSRCASSLGAIQFHEQRQEFPRQRLAGGLGKSSQWHFVCLSLTRLDHVSTPSSHVTTICARS